MFQVSNGCGFLPGDRLDADDALVARLVRQPGRAGDVADRVDALDIGPAVAVDDDMAAVGLHAQRLEPDILGVRDDADGDDGVAEIALDLPPPLIVAFTPSGPVSSFSTPERDVDLHPLLGQRLVDEGGDVLVLDREDPVEHLDDRHLGAHVRIEAGELDPDRARSDHQQLGRHHLAAPSRGDRSRSARRPPWRRAGRGRGRRWR